MARKERIVVALGGNALGKTPEEQQALIEANINSLADLSLAGHQLVITHGNGPQVGMINLAFANESVPAMPFPECGAMSQGYIGYHLQNALDGAFIASGSEKRAAAIITQVVVSEADPAFANPTKPIGSFYTEAEAAALAKASGEIYREDSGRGWRRVVPSPMPIDIVEKDIILKLVDSDFTVIASGGGGIPVVARDNSYVGTAAVIDKDFAAEKLAELVEAETLVILTAVEQVAINFNTAEVKWLDKLTVAEAERFIEEGQFAKGSMLPKVEAAIRFARSKSGRKAIITSLEKSQEALKGLAGTTISE